MDEGEQPPGRFDERFHGCFPIDGWHNLQRHGPAGAIRNILREPHRSDDA
jgi:hypothetical protein